MTHTTAHCRDCGVTFHVSAHRTAHVSYCPVCGQTRIEVAPQSQEKPGESLHEMHKRLRG